MKIDAKFPKIEWDQAFLQQEFNDWAAKEALSTATNIISNLTQGVDANGGAMKEYSASYQKYLASIGESPDTTDLHRTGALHGSIQVENQPNGAQIVFMGSHPTARVSNAALAQQLYSRGFTGWFQIGKQDLEFITKSFEAWIDLQLKKIEIKEGQ